MPCWPQGKRSRAAYRDVRARTARLNAFLNEQVSGIAVVQAFVRERTMAEEFDAINVDYRDANKRAIYYEAVLDAAIEMVSTLCIASILWFSGMRRVGPHAITFPLLVTFLGIGMLLAHALAQSVNWQPRSRLVLWAVAFAGLLLLTPRLPYLTGTAAVPRFFADSVALSAIPAEGAA